MAKIEEKALQTESEKLQWRCWIEGMENMNVKRKFTALELKTCKRIQAKIRWTIESIESNILDCPERRKLIEQVKNSALEVGSVIAAKGIVEREKAE